jgi:predicted MFS family arabinose efflux permease
LIGWRWAFWWLVLPSAALLWQMWRLPEPARDGQTRLRPGQVDIPDERQVERDGAGERAEEVEEAEEEAEGERASHSVGEEVQREHVPPRRELVLTEDPTDRSLWWALRYVLAVPTNRVLIIASALGYFYFQGLKSFALIFVTQHYRIPQSLASLLTVLIGAGALAGVWLGGRAADRLLGREVVNARVIVPTIALVGVVVTLAPAAAMTSIGAALPLLILAAGSLGAVNPPLDAARLDIMHPALWGRAESVRTWLRSAGEAIAPLLFGWVSETVFGGRNGLEYTLLLFLITLVAAAGLALRAWRTYGRDVATAAESHRREPS